MKDVLLRFALAAAVEQDDSSITANSLSFLPLYN
jgi:hypothetical protein